MLIFASETPLAPYHCNEMVVQEVCPGFMILEEDIAEDDENIFMD